MNKLTVWDWSYSKTYYLRHPLMWLKELKWNIQAAHQRATKGYCDTDWRNFDMWFKHVAPQMLRDMAMYGHAYPGCEPFDTPEKWHSWLHRMADQITYCQDEDNGNEYYKPYINMLKSINIMKDGDNPEVKELSKKYYDRYLEVTKEQDELFKKTMYELLEHWEALWD